MSRPYTGTRDGIAKGKREGTEAFVAAIQIASGGQLWGNGTFGVRQQRGRPVLSVHATGRAADISRRKMSAARPGCSRADIELVIDWMVANADAIGLEFLGDYEPRPGGRGWKCDRYAWKNWRPGEVKGAPGGDWIHVELDPEHADSTDWIAGVMATFPLSNTPPTPPEPAGNPYPGVETKRGSRATARVRQIQQALADKGYRNSSGTAPLVVDGDFGNATDAAVRAFQDDAGLFVDGIVGPRTWGALFA